MTSPQTQRPTFVEVMLLILIYGITAMIAVPVIAGRTTVSVESNQAVDSAVPREPSTARHTGDEVITPEKAVARESDAAPDGSEPSTETGHGREIDLAKRPPHEPNDESR